MNIWGSELRLMLFGSSHGAAVGCLLDGLPVGKTLDEAAIKREIARRAPSDKWATARREADEYEILSGLYEGHTDGTPLCAIFRNKDAQEADYQDANIARPSHADYTSRVKYAGFNDPRGGGMFSGRMTLPLVFAGAVAKQFLFDAGIATGAHVYMLGGVYDAPFDPAHVDEDTLKAIDNRFPLVDDAVRAEMEEALDSARYMSDSVGGMVEAAAVGVPVGLGEPFFDTLEGTMSKLLFAIPGVKAVEFGAGLEFASMPGSLSNDALFNDGKTIRTFTNSAGGINGGISNGMPIIVRACFRAVPTIHREQYSVNMDSGENVAHTWEGRHDVSILPRGVVAVESAVSVALLDAYIAASRRSIWTA